MISLKTSSVADVFLPTLDAVEEFDTTMEDATPDAITSLSIFYTFFGHATTSKSNQ